MNGGVSTRKKVLIIGNGLGICQEIKCALQNKMIEVHYVFSADEGIKLLIQHSFFLVIIDIAQSEINGIEILKLIRRIRLIPVLVLSSTEEESERIAAFKAGAHGYLKKPYTIDECLAQAYSLMELYIQSHTAENSRHTLAFGKNLIISLDKHQAILMGEPMNLTRKEFDLLFYLASHAGQVLSREQLYRAVWNEDSAYNVDESVKSHIKSLRKKLFPLGKEYIQNEWGVGYRFSLEDGK